MQVVTINLNGIRSAVRKGFNTWLESETPDIICTQETKAQMNSGNFSDQLPKPYFCSFSDAVKKGYSGVGIYSLSAPNHIKTYGNELFDNEGRYLEAHFDNVIIISLYLPSGTSGAIRQQIKMACLENFYQDKLIPLLENPKPVIICGDFNIAHRKIDLKNWRSNQNKSGFLPEERSWFSSMLQLGWHDVFRELYPESEQYTWWTYRSAARSRNVGWRLDYQIASSKTTAVTAKIIDNPIISDHAPLMVKYELPN